MESIERKEFKIQQKQNFKKMAELEKNKKRTNIPENEYLCEMKDNNNVIEIDELQTSFFTDLGIVKAVNNVTYQVPKGKTVALVGESGCGKSVTSLSIMRLISGPTGQITGGQIRYNREDGKAIDITKVPMSLMQEIRGNEISMIFQEPMTSLNPIFTIGMQIGEAILLHNKGLSKKDVNDSVIKLLDIVGIARPQEISKCYPHELSGGMRQRVMIAISLSCSPRLLIADEPTTALDVTIQAQILDLLRSIKEKYQTSILLITHDLGVVAEMADIVVVMYAGKIVEYGNAIDIYKNPSHPYTVGLLKSKPSVTRTQDKLYSIPGQVPNPINMPNTCYFKDRCDRATDECNLLYPELISINDTHKAACFNCHKGGV